MLSHVGQGFFIHDRPIVAGTRNTVDKSFHYSNRYATGFRPLMASAMIHAHALG